MKMKVQMPRINVPARFQNLNFKIVGLLCAGIFLFGIIFAYVIFPPILRAILISQVILKPGTQMRDMYDELPFPLIFKVYLFHVLNPDEVMKGGKPKFEERGPYVFEEWKKKYDQVEDTVEDTIEFTLQNTYIFNKTLSNGLTGNEEIVLAHPLVLGIPLTINVDRAPMLPLVAKAIDEIFHNPKDIFFHGKVMDILFHGVDVDCTSTDFNAKATCSAFEGGDVKTVTPSDVEDMYKFSMFGATNATPAGRWKTYRGMKNISDLGRVILFENEPEQDVWDGDECNKFVGTDSTIFPPFMTKEQGIWSFEPAICRSMGAVYEKPSKYAGLPTFHYSLDMGDIGADENLHCFCEDGECPVKGTMNLFPCVGVPLVASMPHFWNGDDSLFEKVASGINPEKDKHEIFVDLELISGTPLSAAKRLQINIDLMPLEEIEIMKNIPEMIFPLIWVEEGANLNKTFVNMLKYQLFLGLKARFVVKWLCLIVGFFGGITAAILEYQKQNVESNSVVQDVKVFTESTTAQKINADAAVRAENGSPLQRIDVVSRGKEIDLERY